LRSLARHLVLAVALFALAGESRAAELLMFRRAGCPWCLEWDKTVGPAYPNSDLGRRLTLRLVDLDRDPAPKVALARPVRYTPTFVLIDGEREIGRIEGYPGADFFWGLLERLARDLPPAS
jgi:hypothetical protein